MVRHWFLFGIALPLAIFAASCTRPGDAGAPVLGGVVTGPRGGAEPYQGSTPEATAAREAYQDALSNAAKAYPLVLEAIGGGEVTVDGETGDVIVDSHLKALAADRDELSSAARLLTPVVKDRFVPLALHYADRTGKDRVRAFEELESADLVARTLPSLEAPIDVVFGVVKFSMARLLQIACHEILHKEGVLLGVLTSVPGARFLDDTKVPFFGTGRLFADRACSLFALKALKVLPRSGGVDSRFANQGYLVSDFGRPECNGRGIATDGEGRAYVLSSCIDTSKTYAEAVVSRLSVAGVVDTTYGKAGTGSCRFEGNAQITSLPNFQQAESITAYPDGRIVTGSSMKFGIGIDHAYYCGFKANGENDVDFAKSLGAGSVNKGVLTSFTSGSSQEFGALVATLGDGKLAAGFCQAVPRAGGYAYHPVLFRMTADTQLDTLWNNLTWQPGIAVSTYGPEALQCPRALLPLSDRKLLHLGSTDIASGPAYATRLGEDASLDEGFGDKGIAYLGPTGAFSVAIAAAGTTDGKVAVLLDVRPPAGVRRLDVVLLGENGRPDPGFYFSGSRALEMPAGFAANGTGALLWHDSTKRLVVTGTMQGEDGNRQVGVWALKIDGNFDRTFGATAPPLTYAVGTTSTDVRALGLTPEGYVLVGSTYPTTGAPRTSVIRLVP